MPMAATLGGSQNICGRVHDKGEQLIVMGDWNSRMKDVDSFFETLGMEEAILEQHKTTPLYMQQVTL